MERCVNDKKINSPVWIECDDSYSDEYIELIISLYYEVVLRPKTNEVYFYGAKTKLQPQQYKFLKTVLNQSISWKNNNVRKISAKKIMHQIGSKCENVNDLNKFANRIKNKIKSEIKKSFKEKYPDFYLPISNESGNWNLDKDEHTMGLQRPNKQFFDFEKYFNQLICVEKCEYYTYFLNYDKVNKKFDK